LGRDPVVFEQPGNEFRIVVGNAPFGVEQLFEGLTKSFGEMAA